VQGAHTPSKNPRLVSRTQAYVAYLLSTLVFEGSVVLCSENDLRNAWETVVR
jgi:hypothetical protein